MTAPNARTAAAAVDAARPIVARLDLARDPEDVAADLLDAWSHAETALRAYLGGSGMSGQGLVRELRQREMLSLEQAHALLEFLSARDRANRPSYRPTSADVAAAREGFRRVEEAVAGGGLTPAAYAAAAGYAGAASASGGFAPPRATSAGGTAAPFGAGPSAPPAPAVAPLAGDGVGYVSQLERRGPGRTLALILALALLVTGGAWYLLVSRGGSSRGVSEATALYSQGKREAARAAFEKIARDDPSLATPHVYLGRIAREEGDMRSAQNELQMAVRLDPANSIALREMGSYLLATGNNELARKFYVRALQSNASDKSAQGFLGCSLYRLGRQGEAQTWFSRAGQGPWSSCAVPAAAAPGATVGAYVPARPLPAGRQLPAAPR
jgi:tetratricopeptide (TPR) repeat protein